MKKEARNEKQVDMFGVVPGGEDRRRHQEDGEEDEHLAHLSDGMGRTLLIPYLIPHSSEISGISNSVSQACYDSRLAHLFIY